MSQEARAYIASEFTKSRAAALSNHVVLETIARVIHVTADTAQLKQLKASCLARLDGMAKTSLSEHGDVVARARGIATAKLDELIRRGAADNTVLGK